MKGFNTDDTTIAPSPPLVPTRNNDDKAEYKILELFLKYSTAMTVITIIERPTMIPNIRLPYSIHASTILKAVGSMWAGI